RQRRAQPLRDAARHGTRPPGAGARPAGAGAGSAGAGARAAGHAGDAAGGGGTGPAGDAGHGAAEVAAPGGGGAVPAVGRPGSVLDDLAPPDEVGQEGPELVAEVGTVERQLDRRPEEVDLLAEVVAARLERVAAHRLRLEQQADGVGQLQLAAGAGRDAVEGVEDLRREDVTADDRQVGGGVLRLGLLDDRPDADEVLLHQLRGHTAVVPDVLSRYLEDGHHRAPVALVDVEHRPQQLRVVDHDVVAEEDGERFRAHVLAGHRHGVAQPEG